MSYKSTETQTAITNEPIVHEIIEKPILIEVKDRKNLQVIHKDVVQEIHQTPIIEIQRKAVTEHIIEDAQINKIEAPIKYEHVDKSDGFIVDLPVSEQQVITTQEVGDIKHMRLDSDVTHIVHQEIIEQHIIPTVTEIHEQTIVNLVEQPIIRTIVEKPIIRETIFTGDAVIAQPEVLVTSQQHISAEIGEIPFTQAVEEKGMLLENAHSEHHDKHLETRKYFKLDAPVLESSYSHQQGIFTSESFKQDLVSGHEHLHVARPFAAEDFVAELSEGKEHLSKSRYFSKPVFIPEFMAKKVLLKPTTGNVFSEELSKLEGNWKIDPSQQTVGNRLWLGATNFYHSVQHQVSSAINNSSIEGAKHMIEEKVDAVVQKLHDLRGDLE